MKAESKVFKCPFYHKSEGTTITCAGLLVDDGTIKHVFTNKAAFRYQVGQCCQGDYEQCEYYNVLMELWRRENE